MPCFSQIQTKMIDGIMIADALKALGYKIIPSAKDSIVAEHTRGRIYFYKQREVWFAAGNTWYLPTIIRQYAELGVKQWAGRRGFAVINRTATGVDTVQLTLVNRRG